MRENIRGIPWHVPMVKQWWIKEERLALGNGKYNQPKIQQPVVGTDRHDCYLNANRGKIRVWKFSINSLVGLNYFG